MSIIHIIAQDARKVIARKYGLSLIEDGGKYWVEGGADWGNPKKGPYDSRRDAEDIFAEMWQSR